MEKAKLLLEGQPDCEETVLAIVTQLAFVEASTPVGSNVSQHTTGAVVGFQRELEQVTVESVEIDGGQADEDGAAHIVYRRDGRCTPYRVRLVDRYSRHATIEVDAMCSVTTEMEQW